MQFLLDNIDTETTRAQEPEELQPVIANIVNLLDQTLIRYFELAAEREDSAPSMCSIRAISRGSFSYCSCRSSAIIRRSSSIPTRVPVVSIIIPVYNKFELTYQLRQVGGGAGAQVPYEIIVVDDCSRDETLLAKLVFRQHPAGPQPGEFRIRASCNRGFEAARGEYVVFLNNDTMVKPRWLDELYETLRRDPKIGIAGSKLLFPDGTAAGMRRHHLAPRRRLELGPRPGRERSALLLSARRRLRLRRGADDRVEPVQRARRFDEHFAPGYYEDTDLCFRVRQLGYRMVVQPASEIMHFEGASSGTRSPAPA